MVSIKELYYDARPTKSQDYFKQYWSSSGRQRTLPQFAWFYTLLHHRLFRMILYSEYYIIVCLFVFGATAPQWARASSFTRFLNHTQCRPTVGMTPLDEWSARHRYLYLTTHDTQISMPPVGFEAAFSTGEQPQRDALDGAATATGVTSSYKDKICTYFNRGQHRLLMWQPAKPLASRLSVCKTTRTRRVKLLWVASTD